MSHPSNKCLVRCASYNGHKDILFMADSDDHRIGASFTLVTANCRYDRKAKTLVVGGTTYRVFSDWSLGPT